MLAVLYEEGGKREKGSGSGEAERKVRESECAKQVEKRVGEAKTVEAGDGSSVSLRPASVCDGHVHLPEKGNKRKKRERKEISYCTKQQGSKERTESVVYT